MESEVFEESLECQLTASEVLQRGQAAARLAHAIDQAEAERARVKKAHKVEVGDMQARLTDLQREVRTGKATRAVRCVEQADYEDGMMHVIRIDTGERVRSRPLTEKERQVDFLARSAKSDELPGEVPAGLGPDVGQTE